MKLMLYFCGGALKSYGLKEDDQELKTAPTPFKRSPIISASRRTDIPGLYLPWFKQRIREKICAVANPFNPTRITRVSLDPSDVSCIVFWTRNPGPLLKDEDEFEDGLTFLEYLKKYYNFYFLFTITGYPRKIEPATPSLEKSIDNFKKLARQFSLKKWERRKPAKLGEEPESPVIWRFDPVFISKATPYKENVRLFDYIASQLKSFCHRVIISVYDPYKKSESRLKRDNLKAMSSMDIEGNPEFAGMVKFFKNSAQKNNMKIQTCCENLENLGVPPGACIDGELINDLFNLDLKLPRDKNQRKLCRCVKSFDVGAYDTCIYGCKYCYACRRLEISREKYNRHYKEKYHTRSLAIDQLI